MYELKKPQVGDSDIVFDPLADPPAKNPGISAGYGTP